MIELRLLVHLSVLCWHTVAVATIMCDSLSLQNVGTALSVSAVCYPNGSAVFTWSSTARRTQIEYECHTEQDTDAQPEQVVALAWTEVVPENGSRVVDDIWNENRTCTFSGCYQTYDFTTHWIQSTNCTIQVEVAPTTTSASVEPPTTTALPTMTSAVLSTSATASTPVLSPGPLLGRDAIIIVAVVASVVFGIVVCVGLIIILITVYKKLETRNYDPKTGLGAGPYKDAVDLYYEPVLPGSANSYVSIATLLEYLDIGVRDTELATEKTGTLSKKRDGDNHSTCTQSTEDIVPSYRLDVMNKTPKDGDQPENKQDDDCSVHIQLTEDTADQQPPVRVAAATPEQGVGGPHRTGHVVNTRGYIPNEQVLSPATSSTLQQ